MAPGLVPSPRHPGGCDDMLLSPSDPRAQRGENGVTRQTTSSTTHSLAGPSPSASMTANPANALTVSVPLMQFCAYFICLSTIACQYATYLFLFRVFGPRASGGQQSYYNHVYSSSRPYGSQILVLFFYLPIGYDVYAHACWRFVIIDIPRSRLRTGSVLLLWGGVLITPSQLQ